MKTMLFMYNPKSGRGLINLKLAETVEILSQEGYDVIIHPTTSDEDTRLTAMRFADKADIIAVAGGDGTLQKAAAGVYLSGKDVPIGLIPTGSTNDYAVSTSIPVDIPTAARNIINGRPVKLDLGQFNTKHFMYIAAFGLFTDVSYTTDQRLKNVFGHTAYLFEAGKKIFNVPVFNMKVTSDQRIVEDGFVYGMITNGRSVGGIKDFAWKNVDLSDGLFEVTLVKEPTNPLVLQNIITHLLDGEPSDHIIKFRTRKLTIESESDIAWTTDGEAAGEFKKVEITNIPEAVSLIMHREPGEE